MNMRQTGMKMKRGLVILLITAACACSEGARPEPDRSESGILRFDNLEFPETRDVDLRIHTLLTRAVGLTQKHLPYLYGVADPNRGFDCSGMVFHLLQTVDAPHVPRQANTLQEWLVQKDAFVRVRDPDDLDDLEPGDLLFWTGTYNIDRRVTHVMIYLGTDRKTGRRWMVGTSSRRNGINLFPFDPAVGNGAGKHFFGYGKTEAFLP